MHIEYYHAVAYKCMCTEQSSAAEQWNGVTTVIGHALAFFAKKGALNETMVDPFIKNYKAGHLLLICMCTA